MTDKVRCLNGHIRDLKEGEQSILCPTCGGQEHTANEKGQFARFDNRGKMLPPEPEIDA